MIDYSTIDGGQIAIYLVFTFLSIIVSIVAFTYYNVTGAQATDRYQFMQGLFSVVSSANQGRSSILGGE